MLLAVISEFALPQEAVQVLMFADGQTRYLRAINQAFKVHLPLRNNKYGIFGGGSALWIHVSGIKQIQAEEGAQ